MYRNSHNKSSKTVLMISRYFRRAVYIAMLGLKGRQWVACAIICAMLSLSVTAPTSVSVVRAADSELSKFEPVNEKLSVLTSIWRNVNADLEARLTPWRPVNWAANAFSDDDESKRNPTNDDRATADTAKDKPSVEARKHDSLISEPKPEPVMKEDALLLHAANAAPAMPAALVLTQLPIEERDALFSPENNLGTPPGQTEPGAMNGAAATKTRERAGIANFGFDVPIAGLSGRGMDAGVGVTYNSRVWTKSIASGGGNHFTYDVENSWLAAGFNLSLGYLELDYPSGQSPIPRILTDPNGTRHQLFSVGSGLYETADGTFIQVNGYTATYPDGTKIRYYTDLSTGFTQKHYPTAITDRHGNVIYTVYESDLSGRLKYISDTLGRYIRFHYDTTPEKKLVAVTMPSLNAAPNSATSDPTLDRQTVRFYYETLTLQYQNRFDGVITVPNNGQIQVLKYVYFPGTKTGYQYDYSSSYGMIYKITNLAGMQVTTNSLTQTGSVLNTLDVEAAWTKYNYPGTDTEPPSPTLTDMPKYNKRIDEWAGRTGGGISPETFFNVIEDAGNLKRTTTITSPDNTVSETIANLKPGLWDDGLIKETAIKNSGGGVMSKNAMTWEQGPAGAGGRLNPRVKQVDVTNDVNQTKATILEYVDLLGAVCQYNNVCQVKEYDFVSAGAALLRNTVTTYETGTTYINNRLLNLVKSVKVIVGGTTVSRTEFSYDTQALTTYANIGNFDASYNPATGGATLFFCEPGCGGTRQDCCWTIPGYNNATTYRGNITQIKRWADAAVENDPLADITVIKYDVVGNVIETTANCCQVKRWVYNDTNQYAFPIQSKSGLNNELVTSAAYDFNTGLMTSSTNENNQVTNYQYETDTLRPKKTIYPNGGYVESFYSDKEQSGSNLVPGYARQTTTLESNKFAQSYSYFDGRGLGIRSASETPDGWLISAVEYDSLGRVKRSYNPFYGSTPTTEVPEGTKYSELTAIDALGRTTGVTLQDNTSVSTYFSIGSDIPTNFNKTFVTVTDQAGKKRRQVADALGRIVRVDEPDANGSLGAVDATLPVQQTSYEYDGNDNLSKVTQSDGTTTQERKFRYDSLSRLVAERQVEADATLDLDGTHGTPSSSKWTKVLKYDTHGLLTDGYDARGVNTHFAYDGLNRISAVTYLGETGYQTPAVTYTYDQDRGTSFKNLGALTKVETAASGDAPATKTEFDYDLMGRVSKHRQWIGTQQYDLEYGYNLAGQLTSEKYPSGRIVTMGYDAKGRMASVSDQSRTYLSGLVYAGKGGSISAMNFGNGTAETFGLNDRFQIETQELKKGSATLQKYNYNYGQIDVSNGNIAANSNNGQLAKVESWIGTAKQWEQRFGYDSIGRLKESREIRGDDLSLTYKQVFDYDRFGNMYRKSANNNPNGQINPLPYTPIEEGTDISKSTNRLASNTTYDDAGNVTTDNKFRTMGFGYDANGRMVKATKTSVPDALSVYDASGMRVAEKVNDVWRFLIYDVGGKLVTEYGGLQSTDEGGVKYLLSDWQGSTRAVLSNTGVVNGRMDYSAFGEEIGSGTGMRTSAQGFGAANAPRQKYGLTERDDGTGLDHTWFRKHENRAGRWTGADPYNGSMSLGNPQSFNRYSYVENQPTNFIDPSGLNADASESSGYCIRYHYTNGTIGFWGPWQCYGAGGGGGGNGGGQGSGSGNENISERCKDLLKKFELWDSVAKLLGAPPIIDVDSTPSYFDVFNGTMANDLGSDYFGNYALPGETVGATINRTGAALAHRGAYGPTGIYVRFGTNLSGDFLLHELVHLIQPGSHANLDDGLVYLFGIIQDEGMSSSAAVDRFFNSHCDPKYRDVV